MNKIKIAECINKESLNKLIINDNEIIIKEDGNFIFQVDNLEDYDLNIKILKNVNVLIEEINTSKNININYTYELEENSHLIINKFYDVVNLNENDNIYLNNINANIDFNLKIISKESNKFLINAYHNACNTVGNINTKGVSIQDGNITLDVSSYIPNGIKGCIANQINHIVSLNDKKNIIKPNLYIDEEDVIANHSAYIGKFDEEIIFYLESRGLNEDEAINLLIKGFLNSENDMEKEIINKYWR